MLIITGSPWDEMLLRDGLGLVQCPCQQFAASWNHNLGAVYEFFESVVSVMKILIPRKFSQVCEHLACSERLSFAGGGGTTG